MKIVRIIARLNVGGPAKHVIWLTADLQNAECRTVLVAGTVPAGEEDMGYFAEELGVKPVFIPEMSREISPKDAVTIWKLYKLFVRERPDIVHTHTAKAGTVGRVAGLLYRWFTPGTLIGRPRSCRLVHTYHGHIFHGYYGRMKTLVFVTIERTLARLGTDRIVVISEQQRREIHEEFHVGKADQFSVIRLGLDTRVFSSWKVRRQLFRDELGADKSDIIIGIVGRLTEIKNHVLFFQAAKHYKNQYGTNRDGRSIKFVVIGNGHLHHRLEDEVRVLDLTEDVVFAGMRKDPEFFYPALDVVALTSRNEGTPLTLIEAMLNARPVIATAVGGVVDLLGRVTGNESNAHSYATCERGIRVRPDDVEGFAAGLARLIDDESLRKELGERGCKFVAENYSKERLREDVLGLYQDLTKPAMKPRLEPQV